MNPMKNFTTTLAIIATATLFSAALASAASTSSSANASIVSAIAITNTAPLNFGQIAPTIVIGTVSVATTGERAGLGGVTLANGSTPAAASFAVTGAANNTYTITLPASTTLTGPGAPMTVDGFVSNPDATGTGTLSALGAQTLLVGATLHVGVSQVAGAYTGTFNVDVNYN